MTSTKRAKVKKDFLSEFENSCCNVSTCCKKMNISRNCFYDWKKQDSEFRESIEELEESLLDFGETMLYKAVKKGKTAELIFYLKTKGKKRGYFERLQTEEISDREPVEVRIVMPTNEDKGNDKLSED